MSSEGHARAATLAPALRVLLFVAGVSPWILALARIRAPEVVLAFAMLCHQLPERTLVVLGEPMVVCSRCAGLYAGIALGALVSLPRFALPRARALLLGALGLMIADVATQDLGLHPPFHPTRLASGVLLGWIAAAWMTRVLSDQNATSAMMRSTSPSRSACSLQPPS